MTARDGLIRPYVLPAGDQPAARHLSRASLPPAPTPPPALTPPQADWLPAFRPAGELPEAPRAPVDAVDPVKWLTGYWMRQYHAHSTMLGCCVGCGSTEIPWCGYSRAGYNMMRASLADPSTMPLIDP